MACSKTSKLNTSKSLLQHPPFSPNSLSPVTLLRKHLYIINIYRQSYIVVPPPPRKNGRLLPLFRLSSLANYLTNKPVSVTKLRTEEVISFPMLVRYLQTSFDIAASYQCRVVVPSRRLWIYKEYRKALYVNMSKV